MRLAFVLLAAFAATRTASGTDGTICIAPVTKAMMTDVQAYPGDREPRKLKFAFSVQLDKRPKIDVPAEKGVRLLNVTTGSKHLIRIRDAGELIESFFFTFEERGGADLCLSFTPFYATWSLDTADQRSWCLCK